MNYERLRLVTTSHFYRLQPGYKKKTFNVSTVFSVTYNEVSSYFSEMWVACIELLLRDTIIG